MTKYVYNFEEMNNVKQVLNVTSGALLDDISSFQDSILTELVNWTGPASEKFKEAFDEYIIKYTKYANNIESLSNFINETSNEISSTEHDIANLHIF